MREPPPPEKKTLMGRGGSGRAREEGWLFQDGQTGNRCGVCRATQQSYSTKNRDDVINRETLTIMAFLKLVINTNVTFFGGSHENNCSVYRL